MGTQAERNARWGGALAGKIVLVTGSSRGIGADVAKQAAAAGATVVLVARDQEALEGVANDIRRHAGEAHVMAMDLTDDQAVDALVARVLEEFGGVDVLVHNAARSIRRPLSASLDRFHDFERTMRLNYFAPVRMTLGFLPSLRERRGSVSLVLTMGVLIPGPYFAAYLASKAALGAFGDSLASETRHDGVHVCSVYLPLVKTEMMAPTKEYAGRSDIMTPERAAELVLDGVVQRKRRMMSFAGRRYAFYNTFSPALTTRMLNVLQQTFPAGDEESRYPRLRRVLKRTLGGSPI